MQQLKLSQALKIGDILQPESTGNYLERTAAIGLTYFNVSVAAIPGPLSISAARKSVNGHPRIVDAFPALGRQVSEFVPFIELLHQHHIYLDLADGQPLLDLLGVLYDNPAFDRRYLTMLLAQAGL